MPSASTSPPYTVKTDFIASIRPCSDVICSGGSTTSTASVGNAVHQCLAHAGPTDRHRDVAARVTISSAAVDGNSTPTKE